MLAEIRQKTELRLTEHYYSLAMLRPPRFGDKNIQIKFQRPFDSLTCSGVCLPRNGKRAVSHGERLHLRGAALLSALGACAFCADGCGHRGI